MTQKPELLVRPLHGEPFRFPVDKPVITIGRSKRNDLVLADQWLSRHHAEIRDVNGDFAIHDLDSRNGTLVNGVRINTQRPLQNGDIITLGDQSITFMLESSGSVIMSESPSDLDMEGTVVVPTEQLLAAARGQEETWDNLESPGARPPASALQEDPARIVKQNQILTALSQASMALISDRPVTELMEFILELAFRVVKAERGFLMLTATRGNGNDNGGNVDALEVKAVRSSTDEDLDAEGITFSRSIAEKVISEKVSILTSNAMTDPRFRSQDSIVAVGIRSAMCVPLWNNKIVTGLIYVDSRIHDNVFNQDDLSLLTSLANVAAIKLENAKLVQEMIEKKRIEHELEQARRIQKEALPGLAPDLKGWDIYGTNTPCYTVGGDYYDFVTRPGGNLAFALGDVSGKGIPAAMMMMVLRATVNSSTQQKDSVDSIIAQTNRVMFHNSPEQSYVTFFLGDLNPESGDLSYVNAGHIPPILYRAASKSHERLEVGGTVVGLFDGMVYEEGQTQLESGDILIVFTDGISEAWGEDDEEFGEERMADLIKKHASLNAKDLIDTIQQEVDRYTGGSRPSDDCTMVVVKRA
jgi:serine phosphatase RsbU (regulator of sigma subunit)/pSer/pThr/pTyr-binding forkhead associated (FHA) protein